MEFQNLAVREVVVRTIGSGSNDPEKYAPDASRETLVLRVFRLYPGSVRSGQAGRVR